jgi:hypothetical protein
MDVIIERPSPATRTIFIVSIILQISVYEKHGISFIGAANTCIYKACLEQ